MDSPGREPPAKMRQQDPYSPADSELVAVLDSLRPWSAEAPVDQALRAWASDRGIVIRDAAAVAAELRKVGRYGGNREDARDIAAMAAFMLVNVAMGRDATNYGLDAVVGLPQRTRSRYIARYGSHALPEVIRRRVEYPAALAALMRGGRSEQAARAWIRRNPGRRYPEAPPPRRG